MTIADLLMVAATTLAEVAAEVIGDKGGYSAIDAANKARKSAARANWFGDPRAPVLLTRERLSKGFPELVSGQ
jgi:hypothetical protein